jgi:MFS family permease
MSVSELSLTLLAFLTGLSFTVVAPVLPLYVESFGVSYEVLGLFFSAYSLTWGLLQLYTGYLSDRYGRRRLALVGLAIYSMSALGCAEARSFPQLLLFRIIQGVGLGFMGPALLGLVAGLKRQERAFALYRTAQVTGDMLGPVIGGVVGRFALGRPFLLSAAASGLAIVATFLLREETAEGGAKEKVGFIAAARTILSRPEFLLLCLGVFLAEMGYVARGIAMPLAGEAAGLTTEQIGLVMSTYSLVFVLSQVPIGALAEQARHKPLLVGCAFAGALGFGGLFVSSTAWQMGLAMGMLGLTLGTIFVQGTAWAAELAPPERRSLYLASFDGLIDLSFPIAPALVGIVAGLGVRLPFLFCVPLLLASAGVLSRVPES